MVVDHASAVFGSEVIHPDDLQPVEKLPNGISRAGLLEAYRQAAAQTRPGTEKQKQADPPW